MRPFQNSLTARVRDIQWAWRHGRSALNPGERLHGRSPVTGRLISASATSHQKTDGRAVAATAAPSASTLPAPGATPGAGHSQKQTP